KQLPCDPQGAVDQSIAMSEKDMVLDHPAAESTLGLVERLAALIKRNAVRETVFDVRHPTEEVQIVLARYDLAHAEKLVDQPFAIVKHDIEGDEFAVVPIEEATGAITETVEDIGEIGGRKVFELQFAAPAGLIVERGDFRQDRLDVPAALD